MSNEENTLKGDRGTLRGPLELLGETVCIESSSKSVRLVALGISALYRKIFLLRVANGEELDGDEEDDPEDDKTLCCDAASGVPGENITDRRRAE
jgi:hypothetical protein